MKLDKVYNFSKIEPQIYRLWLKSGYFNPDKLKGRPFCMIMPPTNANGDLHIGHALVMGLEDIISRYQRLRGKKVLWLPGTDHAGFETQVVFEKHLEKEGRSRFDMTREEFYQAVWDFTQKNRKNIKEQLKKLGASCDWSREKFTLDKDIIKIVYDTFQNLFADGLIYRDSRIVNYCTKHRTAFSDLEVRHQLRKDKLYYVKYKLVDESGSITVATTRPETIPADVAIAINPRDPRYRGLKGKLVIEPILKNQIPIIEDEAVDINFGTGALKITPAHDSVDFEIGRRHQLPLKKILELDGRFNELAGPLNGLKVAEARLKAEEILRQNNSLEKVEDYEHEVGVCYKCETVIEPMVLEQWFIALTKPIKRFQGKSLRDLAIKAVKDKKIKIIPARFEKVYYHWLKNLKDWNISRQIWWGIPIPVYYCTEKKNEKCRSHQGVIISFKKIKKCPYCGSDKIIKENDTFDTWFSSAQWPYATLMAQKKKSDFKEFYPTDVLETGYDILFFWVARMIMMGLYRTGRIPFRNVYLHGLVRDRFKQKISKSKGNIINPLEVIKNYGSDALRLGLVINNAPGSDLALSEDKVRGYRNFCNKIWNASRFIYYQLGTNFKPQRFKKSFCQTEADRQIINELNETIEKVTKLMDKYYFYQAGEILYHFFWHRFCDHYIEAAKKQLINNSKNNGTRQILYYVLKQSLILLHPFAPFITEAIWQIMFKKETKLLMVARWPKII